MSTIDTSQLTLEDVEYKVRVLPLVYFSIFDHFARKPAAADRVVGTLMGTVKGYTIDVTDCFAVPYFINENEVIFEEEQHTKMVELHKKVYPQETVVGWYATGSSIDEVNALLHGTYQNDHPHAIHLLVDTEVSPSTGTVSVQALSGSQVGIPGGAPVMAFSKLQCTTLLHEEERVALSKLKETLTSPTGQTAYDGELDTVAKATGKLSDLIDKALEYVKKVNAGEIEGDERIGRYLKDTLTAAPKRETNSLTQDLLMVLYLTNLTKSQVAFQAKLEDSL